MGRFLEQLRTYFAAEDQEQYSTESKLELEIFIALPDQRSGLPVDHGELWDSGTYSYLPQSSKELR